MKKKLSLVAAFLGIAVILVMAAFALGVFGVLKSESVKDMDYDGFSYSGSLLNGHFNGYGVLVFDDGSVYRGGFLFGRFDGEGSFSAADGRLIYAGTFKDGRYSGFGLYYSTAGWTYEGDFLEGLFHGEGTIRSDAGEYRGLWERGEQVALYD